MKKVVAITQARIGSSRLPAKILKRVKGKTLLQVHLERISKAKLVNEVRLATTNEVGIDEITDISDSLGIRSFRGSVNNVLDRFYQTALIDKPEFIVRITSDCPLIDPDVIDRAINIMVTSNFDYVSNTLFPTFPDGVDVEVFRFSALEKAHKEASLTSDLEHVTPYIWRNSTFNGGEIFKSFNFENDTDLSHERITVDTIEDYEVIKFLIESLGDNQPFKSYIKLLFANPHIRRINSIHQRNEGYMKSLSNDYLE